MAKILIAEDDQDLADSVRRTLDHHLHSCEVVNDGRSALEYLKAFDYDLLILDWEMPEMSGIEVLRLHRDGGGKTPVLMLTGKSHISNKVQGLDAGADDYLTKPFDLIELSARVRALLRRPVETQGSSLSFGNLEFDMAGRRLLVNEKLVELSVLELQVMEYFMKRSNQVVSQEELIKKAWGADSFPTENAVYSCIKVLRKKLAGAGSVPAIATVYGLGYKLEIN